MAESLFVLLGKAVAAGAAGPAIVIGAAVVVGGVIVRKLAENSYDGSNDEAIYDLDTVDHSPSVKKCHERTAPTEETKKFLPVLQKMDELIQNEHKRCEQFEKMPLSYQRQHARHNKSVPSSIEKEAMMLGVMHARFTDGTELKICTFSGNNPLSFTISVEENFDIYTFTEGPRIPYALSRGPILGYTLVDPGLPTGRVYNVYTGEETEYTYTRSCALQKLYFVLTLFMKAYGKKIKSLKWGESYSKKGKAKHVSGLEEPCHLCKKAFPFLFHRKHK